MKEWQFTSLIGHAWSMASFFLPSGPPASIALGLGVGMIVWSSIEFARA